MVEQLWFSMREVCKALNMRKGRFLNYIARGRLPHGMRRGNRFFWSERDIRMMAWMEENRHRLVKTERPQKIYTHGHIYFVQQQATLSIKIGFSTNPSKRIASLQCANAEKLILLGTIEASQKEELELHKKFSMYRLEGEWFSKDVLAEISELIGARSA